MEKKLIHEVWKTKRVDLDNKNQFSTGSNGGNIPEIEKIASDNFFRDVRTLLEVCGKDILKPWAAETSSEQQVGADVFAFKGQLDAKMIRSQTGYVVLEGSTARLDALPSAAEWLVLSRQKLQEAGVIEEEEGAFVFRRDCEFSSASAAGANIAGCNINGQISWRLPDGRTLKKVEEEESE